MTDINEKEFNPLCAEYMGIKYRETPCGTHGVIDVNFKPFSDANDRNKVIEKMGVDVFKYKGQNLWGCECDDALARDRDRDTAQNKIIWEKLKAGK